MRLVFAGTPDPALPALNAIAESDHDLIAVVTRPDARRGRGRHTETSPVAVRAEELGIDVLRPVRPKDPEFLEALASLAPDACPVVAYGALIPTDALAIPPHGWINLHFSLLPAWRGAAPVQRAIMAGDDVTGASTFRLEEGLDTGPVYGVLTEPIGSRDTAGDLLERLAQAGARLLVETLDGIGAGVLQPRPQPADGVSLAPRLSTEDGHVDWRLPAAIIDRRIRGCTPSPGAWTPLNNERLGLGPVRLAVTGPYTAAPLGPGELSIGKHNVLVGTASAPVELGEVRAPGRRPMPASDWARGARPTPGQRLG
ncbi:MAG: methionyl-tRNA formyltransferase [Geodermatophilaceae bacterium]